MNIVELAKQAGWDAHHAEFDTRIQTFAKLVAAHEREECAAMCMTVQRTGAYFARLIRARGEA